MVATLRISSDISGGCLVRGINDAGTPIEVYKHNPTLADKLEIVVRNESNVDIWFKADGYLTYYDSISGIVADTATERNIEASNLILDDNVHGDEPSPGHEVNLEYNGTGYGKIQYGYGITTPKNATITIDALFSTKAGLELIADYSSFDLPVSGGAPPNYEHIPSNIIAVPTEVGDITSIEYHNDGFLYIVGRANLTLGNTGVHKLFKFQINRTANRTLTLTKSNTWATNPVDVQTTITGKPPYSMGMAIWNNRIYIADGDDQSNRRDNGKAMSVHNLETGARLGIFTPGIPNGFPIRGATSRTRYFMTGVAIDERHNRMLIFFFNSSNDESILATETLRDEFLDDSTHVAGSVTTFIVGSGYIPETSLNLTPISATIDAEGVLYLANANGNTRVFDIIHGIEMTESTWSAGNAITDVTIYRGAVWAATPSGSNRGIRAYALRNRRYGADDTAPGTSIPRYPEGGENSLSYAPYRFLPDGTVVLDFDFVRLVPHPNVPDWRRRVLEAPIASRYGGIHLPEWTEDGRVYISTSSIGTEPTPTTAGAGTLTDETIAAVSRAVWSFLWDPTGRDNTNPSNTPTSAADVISSSLLTAITRIDNVKAKTDKLQFNASNEVLAAGSGGGGDSSTAIAAVKADTSAIKAQTDKIKFNANNEVIIDDETINTGITTVEGSIQTVEQSVENNTNFLRPMQATLNSVKTTIEETNDLIDNDNIYDPDESILHIKNDDGTADIRQYDIQDERGDPTGSSSHAYRRILKKD